MRTTAFLAIALLAMAGCADDPAPAVATETGPDVITDPADFDYNTSQEHLHDYWGGQQQITVLDERRETRSTSTLGTVELWFRLPADTTVPQGTERVEVTWSWTDGPDSVHGDATTLVRTAASDEERTVGPVDNGGTVVVASTNQDNDLPHQRLSGWTFGIHFAAGPTGGTSFSGELAVQAVAFRGLEIPLYPGHPDRWDGADELPLFAASGLATESHVLGRGCVNGCAGVYAPEGAAVVPHDADHVLVHVESGGATPFRLALTAHGADTWDFAPVEPAEQEGSLRIYRVPVDGNGDGPYALKSLWRFELVPSDPAESTAFTGEYVVEAWAVRQSSDQAAASS